MTRAYKTVQAIAAMVSLRNEGATRFLSLSVPRAYRMGQSRNVLVYRLLRKDTVDEKIMETLAEKQKVFDAFADKSAIAEETLELDEKSVNDITESEIKRIQESRSANQNEEK